MHVHLPKPLHGWRELLGEIGVIVIGILIALGAEQSLEWLHWHHEVGETREALRVELARAVGAYQYSVARQDCADKRLDDLDQWLAHSRAGDTPQMARPIGRPSGFQILTGVWDMAKSGQGAWHMPLEERLRYAHLYGALAAFDEVQQAENDVWRELAFFTRSEPLDHRDRMEMRGLVARARRAVSTVRDYDRYIMPDAMELKITPQRRTQSFPLEDRSFCQRLFVS